MHSKSTCRLIDDVLCWVLLLCSLLSVFAQTSSRARGWLGGKDVFVGLMMEFMVIHSAVCLRIIIKVRLFKLKPNHHVGTCVGVLTTQLQKYECFRSPPCAVKCLYMFSQRRSTSAVWRALTGLNFHQAPSPFSNPSGH